MNTVPVLSFIGINTYAVGELVGRIVRNTRGCSSVLVVHTTENIDNTTHLKNKELGMRSALNQSGSEFQINNLVLGNEAPKRTAIQAISNAIALHDSDTIYFSTSRAYQYAPDLKKAFPKIYIIGHDLFDHHIRLMKNGMIDLLIDQSGYRMGYLGIRSWANHLILDHQIPATQYLPLKIVYPENLPFFDVSETLADNFTSSTKG